MQRQCVALLPLHKEKQRLNEAGSKSVVCFSMRCGLIFFVNALCRAAYTIDYSHVMLSDYPGGPGQWSSTFTVPSVC